MSVKLTVLSPRGKIEETIVPPAPRLKSLAGKKIGVLFNDKSGGGMLLPFVESALRKQAPGVQLRTWKVPFAQPVEAKLPLIKELASYADGVFALMGD